MSNEPNRIVRILNRFTEALIFETTLSAEYDTETRGIRLGAAIKLALKSGADLRDASLRGAELRYAYLRGAYLRGADLRDSSLRDADLRYADLRDASLRDSSLRGADLSYADLRDASLRDADLRYATLRDARLRDASLSGANLSYADLRDAGLRGADLSFIKTDFWDVLLRAQPEIPALLETLRAGRINGSSYMGECACLAGTIAKVRHVNYEALGFADPGRPIEKWFLGIHEGNTPETHEIAKITEGWILEFLALTAAPVEAAQS